MDLARTLIRSVARAFYSTRHILVIDALLIHSALPTEDLALLLGMQQKDLRKLCGKLREDRLLAVHSRQETREGMQRPITKDYYYIDFHATIDAIKYRIFTLTQQVKNLYKPSEERKDYSCPRCSAQWTSLEVLDNVSPLGFLCHRCNSLLQERDDHASNESGGHEKQSRLASQLDRHLKLLRDIDAENIPTNDFETAFSNAIPVQRNDDINPVRATAPLEGSKAQPTAVKGLTQVSAPPLEIQFTTSSEKTAEEQAAETQRKANIAAQNSLPEWHTKSTVTGETTGQKRSFEYSNSTYHPAKEEEADEKKADGSLLNDELAAYYAQMQREKEKEAREDRESSGEEEDEDEFEDVGLDVEGDSTPSSAVSAMNDGAAGRVNGLLSVNGVEEKDRRAAKRVRLEEPGEVRRLESSASFEERADKVSDEDEEADFEDAL